MADDTIEKSAYIVGYKKPPKKNRFKPGQSGNPKGRPKGRRDLEETILHQLGRKIWITENVDGESRKRKIPIVEVIAMRFVKSCMEGNIKALGILRQIQEKIPELNETISFTISTKPWQNDGSK